MMIQDEWNYHDSTPLLKVFAEDHKAVNGHELLSVCVDDVSIGDLLDVDADQQITNMTSQWVGCWVDAWLSATPATAGVIPAGMSISKQGGQNFNPLGGNVHHLVFGRHFKWTATKALPMAYVTLRAWAATSPDRLNWTLQVDQPDYGEIAVRKTRYA